MLDLTHWPNWLQAARLILTFALTAAFGIHAYDSHLREANDAVSPRKWMFWLYAAVFLAASAANLAQLCVAMIFRSYEEAAFVLGYSTLLLVLSYVALLAGAKRKNFP